MTLQFCAMQGTGIVYDDEMIQCLEFSSRLREILRAVAVRDGGAGLEYIRVCLLDEMVDTDQAYAALVVLLQVGF